MDEILQFKSKNPSFPKENDVTFCCNTKINSDEKIEIELLIDIFNPRGKDNYQQVFLDEEKILKLRNYLNKILEK